MAASRNLRDELSDAITDLGLAARPAEVHASLRAFSPRLAARDLLVALSEAQVTALFPAFSHAYAALPSIETQLTANGYVLGPPTPLEAVDPYHFDPDTLAPDTLDPDMGTLPRAALAHGARRGDHPFNSFCALGPDSSELLAAQSPLDPYGPLRLAAERDGKLLLIGVGLERATCLHHAERLAERELFWRWYRSSDRRLTARTGGCSAAFGDFAPVVTPPQRRVVRGAPWSVFDLATLLDEAHRSLVADPYLGLCQRASCQKCPSARARLEQAAGSP